MSVAAEEFLIKLNQQVSGPAAQASGALAKLEAQIRAEARALSGLEDKLGAANAKLAEMMSGAGKGNVSIAAIDKQRAAIAALQAQIEKQKDSASALGAARGTALGADVAKAQAAAEKAAKAESAQADKAAMDEKRKADAEAKRIASDAKRLAGDAKKEEAKRASDARKQAAEAKRISGEKKAALAEETEATTRALGPLAKYAGDLGKAGAVSGAAVGAALALAAAVAAVVVAVSAATIALVSYALAAADAARTSSLFNNAAAGGVAKGTELSNVIGQIALKVPLARAQIEAFGRALELAGISGRRMQVALELITAIESVIPGAGGKIQGLVERFQRLKRAVLTKADLVGTGLALSDVAAQLAKGMGITQAAAIQMLQNGTAGVDKVLDAMKKAVDQKFGKTIAGMMLSLTNQFAQLKDSLAQLFTGVDLDPFLEGLKSITSLFSQSTVTGVVLRTILSSMFQGLIDASARVFPLIRAFMLGMIITALRAYIAFKPIAKAISEAFGNVDGIKAVSTALMAGKIAVYGLIFVLGLVAAVLAMIVGPIVAIGSLIYGAFSLGKLAVSGLVGSVQKLPGAVAGVGDSMLGLGARIVAFFMQLPEQLASLAMMGAGAAGGLVDGFVGGLQAKIGAAIASVASFGAAIEGALRAAIGWNSPATLGVDAAGAIGEGVEVGADKAEGKASESVAKIINPKDAKGAAKAGKGGGKWVYIENFYGSDDNLTKLRAFMGGEFEFQAGA